MLSSIGRVSSGVDTKSVTNGPCLAGKLAATHHAGDTSGERRVGSLSQQYNAQRATREEELRRRALNSRYILIGAGAIIGAIVLVLAVSLLLPPSGKERYEADFRDLENAMLVYTSGLHAVAPPGTAPLEGGGRIANQSMDRYPTFARARVGTSSALREKDAGREEITTLGVAESNPTGSLDQSGTPFWEDVDGDGRRDPANDKLFYHDASPAPAVDHWNTTTVETDEVVYLVDSRDWLIDVDTLVANGHLKDVPSSASPDNSDSGTGSYSWYIDENGEVKSLLYKAPTLGSGGYQEAYP